MYTQSLQQKQPCKLLVGVVVHEITDGVCSQ